MDENVENIENIEVNRGEYKFAGYIYCPYVPLIGTNFTELCFMGNVKYYTSETSKKHNWQKEGF